MSYEEHLPAHSDNSNSSYLLADSHVDSTMSPTQLPKRSFASLYTRDDQAPDKTPCTQFPIGFPGSVTVLPGSKSIPISPGFPGTRMKPRIVVTSLRNVTSPVAATAPTTLSTAPVTSPDAAPATASVSILLGSPRPFACARSRKPLPPKPSPASA